MILSAALTDTGRRRTNNQDCYLINAERQLYLLADGMGGHAAGAVAARLTVDTVNGFLARAGDARTLAWPFGYDVQIPYEHNILKTAVLLANLKVAQSAQETEEYAGMGSTVVAVWIQNGRMVYTHVGDSRLYLLRQGRLRQLTVDHSLVQEQVKRGVITPEDARTHRLRHVVTRAIGSSDRLEVEVQEEELRDGDLVLLCCDGLSDKVGDGEIGSILLEGDALEGICGRLIDAANAAGGDDNITAVLIEYRLGTGASSEAGR